MTSWFQYPITHGYIPSHLASDWDSPHYALDIAMPVGTPITAYKPGVVVQQDYAVWGGKPGGGEVFIKPDDGSDEYYFYHLDKINVRTGQHVGAGDNVGLSGGQNIGGSHPTDPSWSTGPHLHVGKFKQFITTAIGTRPYGPNIQNDITMLKAGGLPSASVTPSQPQTGGINFAQGGMKAGIFLLAIVVILGGSFILFQPQIKETLGRMTHHG